LILDIDAAAVISVYNHPSGNPYPSGDNQKITQKLKKPAVLLMYRFIIISLWAITIILADKGML